MIRTLTVKETDWGHIIELIECGVTVVLDKRDLPEALKSTRIMMRHFSYMGLKTWMVASALRRLAKTLREKYPDNEVDWEIIHEYISKFVGKYNNNVFISTTTPGSRYTWVKY